MSQISPKTTSLIMSLKKLRNPQPKKFFLVQARRLADMFESLKSSLAQSAEELWCWQGNRKLLVLGRNPSMTYMYL